MEKGLTLVLGASPHADRYSYLATVRLVSQGHAVVAVGNRDGIVAGIPIVRTIPEGTRVDTVTLYLNPVNQRQWQPRIMELRPRRIIFNPGTEDDTFAAAAEMAGIEVVEGCTLVMLAAGTY
ncbi:MAG: CoA-binding protein [Flavobacteriales bacterium]|nr:CoA-binding protein [Flavobacteriales bacterium]